MKKLTIRQIAFVIALFASLTITSTSYVLHDNWQYALIIGAVTFVITLLIVTTLLKRYVLHQIKLIYKLINQTKAGRKEAFFMDEILPPKEIEQVTQDVENWAKIAEAEFEYNNKLEAYRRAFLGNLAHELRTPLFSIQGYIDSLLDGAIDDPKVNIKFLENAAKSTNRLVRLVEDLNEITSIENNKVAMQKTHFSLLDILKDCLEEIQLKLSENDIKVHIHKDPFGSLYVFADPDRIKQVIINILNNAIHYCGKHTTITISIYRLESQDIYTEITDDGPGIAEEHLPRIFERLYRVDKSRNMNGGGSGLGLSIVKHIVEAHGGSVNVRSKKGVGTTFGFTLPSRKN